MNGADDVKEAPKDATCYYCQSGKIPAVMCLAEVPLCAYHANQEFPSWRQFMPKPAPSKLPDGLGKALDAADLGM